MPNGGDHSPQRFKELEKPLRSIEVLFQTFAAESDGEYMANYHDHPARQVTVRRGRLVHSVCVSVVTAGEGFKPGPNKAAYVFLGSAWWDVAGGRWLWHKQFAYWPVIPSKRIVQAQMQRAWLHVRTIRKHDMAFFHNPYKTSDHKRR